MEKNLLLIALAFLGFAVQAQFVDVGTTPNTTDQITNSNVGIFNTTPTDNLTIGTYNSSATGTTTTTKVLIQEDNPYIELKDNSGWTCCAGGPIGATFGIKFTPPVVSGYDLSYYISGSGPTLSLRNSNGIGFHINGQSAFMGPGVGSGFAVTSTGSMIAYSPVAFYDNVTIGSAPIRTGYRLFVQEGILTEKLKIALTTSSDWSDFVFEKSYKLPTLSYVENYIKANKHLPGIPSANEVVSEGLDVAEMDAKLLQKIEELTLYLIELKKENEKMKEEIDLLKKMK